MPARRKTRSVSPNGRPNGGAGVGVLEKLKRSMTGESPVRGRRRENPIEKLKRSLTSDSSRSREPSVDASVRSSTSSKSSSSSSRRSSVFRNSRRSSVRSSIKGKPVDVAALWESTGTPSTSKNRQRSQSCEPAERAAAVQIPDSILTLSSKEEAKSQRSSFFHQGCDDDMSFFFSVVGESKKFDMDDCNTVGDDSLYTTATKRPSKKKQPPPIPTTIVSSPKKEPKKVPRMPKRRTPKPNATPSFPRNTARSLSPRRPTTGPRKTIAKSLSPKTKPTVVVNSTTTQVPKMTSTCVDLDLCDVEFSTEFPRDSMHLELPRKSRRTIRSLSPRKNNKNKKKESTTTMDLDLCAGELEFSREFLGSRELGVF